MDRQELTQTLSHAMLGAPDERLFEGRVTPGTIKSRILEAHPPEFSTDGSRDLLTRLGENAVLRLEELSDDLWAFVTKRHVFFVDTLNPRFWLLHTSAPARQLSSLLSRSLISNPLLDSAWMSAEHLQSIDGQMRWIKSTFDSDDLQPENREGEIPRRWRARIEDEAPQELLEILSASRYRASASLTAVGSRLDDPKLGRANVAADYRGGFVSSGSSFEVVAGVLWRSVDRYEAYIKGLEDRFQLRMEPGEDDLGLEFDGEVAHLEFPHTVQELDSFVANLFSSREPFRLWAVPREVRPGEWEANAVDLHVGQTLRLEITAGWTRVLLSESTCGNTLARLVANLQHRFDARTHLAEPVAAA